MGTGIAIVVIVFVTLVFALPIILHRTESAATELQAAEVPTTAQHPIVETTGTCSGSNNAPAVFNTTGHPELPLSTGRSAAMPDTQATSSAPAEPQVRLQLRRSAPQLELIDGSGQHQRPEPAAQDNVRNVAPDNDEDWTDDDAEANVLPMAVGQSRSVELSAVAESSRPDLTAVPDTGDRTRDVNATAGHGPTGEHADGRRQDYNHPNGGRSADHPVASGPAGTHRAGGQRSAQGASGRSGAPADGHRQFSTSASQPRTRLEATMNSTDRHRPGERRTMTGQPSRGRSLAKRAFALVFGLAAVAALATVVACLFTDLLWAVPVLATAVSLSSLLVVVALNFTDVPVEELTLRSQDDRRHGNSERTRPAPARPSAARASASRSAADRPSAASSAAARREDSRREDSRQETSRPAQQPAAGSGRSSMTHAESAREQSGHRQAPARSPKPQPIEKSQPGHRRPAVTGTRETPQQRRAHAAAGIASKLAETHRAAGDQNGGAAGVKHAAEQPPAKPGRAPAPIVVGHDDQTDVIPTLARDQAVLRGADSGDAAIDTGKIGERGTQGSGISPAAGPVAADEPGAGDAPARSIAEPGAASPVAVASGQAGDVPAAPELHLGVGWKPSAVPVPTYVDAEEVPRADPAPLEADETSYGMSANSREQAAAAFAEELGYRPELDDAARDADGPLNHGRAATRMVNDRLGSGDAATNVNDVLARRRA